MNSDKLNNDISYYGGSAAEAGWYEKPGRIVGIYAGERCLWEAEANLPLAIVEKAMM